MFWRHVTSHRPTGADCHRNSDAHSDTTTILQHRNYDLRIVWGGQIPLEPGLDFALAPVHPFSLLTGGNMQSVTELQRRAV